MAELSLPMKDEQEEGAAAVFLTSLLEESTRRGEPHLSGLLSFAARCLHILIPGQRVTRAVASRCVDFMVSREADNARHWSFHDEVARLLEELLAVRNENRPVVVRTMIDRLADLARYGQADDAAAAAAIGLTIGHQRQMRPEAGDEWHGADSAIIAALGTSLPTVTAADIRVAVLLHRRGRLSTLDLVRAHGLETLFSPAIASVREGRTTMFAPIATLFLDWLCSGRTTTLPSRVWRLDWEQLGRQFVTAIRDLEPPFVRPGESRGLMRHGFLTHVLRLSYERIGAQPECDEELLFAGFAILAIAVEMEVEATGGRLGSVGDLGALSSLRNLILNRGEARAHELIQGAEGLALMRSGDRRLAEAWVAGRVTFVGSSQETLSE